MRGTPFCQSSFSHAVFFALIEHLNVFYDSCDVKFSIGQHIKSAFLFVIGRSGWAFYGRKSSMTRMDIPAGSRGSFHHVS